MFLRSGSAAGPNIVAFFLRSGWKIRRVKERYLKFEVYGDQYCIRKVTGQSEMISDFINFPDLSEVDMEEH